MLIHVLVGFKEKTGTRKRIGRTGSDCLGTVPYNHLENVACVCE